MPEAAVVTHPVHQRCERSRLSAVMGLAALAAVANQLGTLQSGQVLRNHGLRDTRAFGQSANGLVAVACQPFEDSSPGRIGEGLEDIVCSIRHAKNITKWLWFVNGKILHPTGVHCCVFPPLISVGFDQNGC